MVEVLIHILPQHGQLTVMRLALAQVAAVHVGIHPAFLILQVEQVQVEVHHLQVLGLLLFRPEQQLQ
tara:strand:+ start:499 stop:699 length:201 start_codon:yes stop_codon:yes gene_type:complete